MKPDKHTVDSGMSCFLRTTSRPSAGILVEACTRGQAYAPESEQGLACEALIGANSGPDARLGRLRGTYMTGMNQTEGHPGGDLTVAVRHAIQGDPGTIDQLAERACTLALRTALLVTGDDALAREIAQDVAVDAVRGLSKLNEPKAFDGWVHTIAVRRTRRAIRRRTILSRAETSIEVLDEPEAPGDQFAEVALRSALSGAIARLPVRQRLAVVLRYVHDLSDADIAQALGCKQGTVNSLLSRARGSLGRAPELADYRPERQGENNARYRRDHSPRLGEGSTG